MGVIFPPNSGCIQVTSWYADNVNDIQEVRFSVPASAWSEFEASDVYRNLVQYLESLQIQDMSTCSREPEYKEESHEIVESSSYSDIITNPFGLEKGCCSGH